MEAIQTEYNGYLFRSRLEARWAVFFDVMGWKYEYEPEGFELSNGLKYLPDFLVCIDMPNMKNRDNWMYVEIKPIDKKMSDYENKKINAFVKEIGKKGLILLEGAPSEDSVYEHLFLFDNENEEIVVPAHFIFDYDKFGMYYAGDPMRDCFTEGYSIRTYEAISKARSARFEFGETPKIN